MPSIDPDNNIPKLLALAVTDPDVRKALAVFANDTISNHASPPDVAKAHVTFTTDSLQTYTTCPPFC